MPTEGMIDKLAPVPSGGFPAEGTGSHRESRIFGLDLLRASAISLVLVSHLIGPLQPLGAYGVELFFALSGFLIGGILFKTVEATDDFTRHDLVRFWLRRWFRTLPNYYWFLLLYTLAAIFIQRVPGELQWGFYWKYPLFLQNFASPSPNFFELSWSLAIEEWFYLLLPGTFFILHALTGKALGGRRAFYVTVGFFVVVPMVLRFTTNSSDQAVLRMVVIRRLDAILFGVILSLIRVRAPRLWAQWRGFAVAGVIMLLGSLILWLPRHAMLLSFSKQWAIGLTFMPAGFACLLPMFYRMPAKKSLFHSSVERVSIWSYSMYLSHMLIYLNVGYLVGMEHYSLAGKLGIRMVCVVIILMVSAVNYRLIEKPAMDLRKRFR